MYLFWSINLFMIYGILISLKLSEIFIPFNLFSNLVICLESIFELISNIKLEIE